MSTAFTATQLLCACAIAFIPVARAADITLTLQTRDVATGNIVHAPETIDPRRIGIIAVEARPLIKGLLEVLLNAAKDRDAMVRVQGAIGLYRRSRKAREAALLIRDLVGERDSLVRLKVVEALGEVAAAGGVGSFGAYQVGILSGDVGAGSVAEGRVVGGAGTPRVAWVVWMPWVAWVRRSGPVRRRKGRRRP